MASLAYHGFRKTSCRDGLKYSIGYIIPSTDREDASGTDFWVKLPKEEELFPVQITQRGIRMFKEYHVLATDDLDVFIEKSEERIQTKREICMTCKVAFVLVRDYFLEKPSPIIAWGDKKALLYGIEHLKRHIGISEPVYARDDLNRRFSFMKYKIDRDDKSKI